MLIVCNKIACQQYKIILLISSGIGLAVSVSEPNHTHSNFSTSGSISEFHWSVGSGNSTHYRHSTGVVVYSTLCVHHDLNLLRPHT